MTDLATLEKNISNTTDVTEKMVLTAVNNEISNTKGFIKYCRL